MISRNDLHPTLAEGWRSPPLSDEEIERRIAKRRERRAKAAEEGR